MPTVEDFESKSPKLSVDDFEPKTSGLSVADFEPTSTASNVLPPAPASILPGSAESFIAGKDDPSSAEFDFGGGEVQNLSGTHVPQIQRPSSVTAGPDIKLTPQPADDLTEVTVHPSTLSETTRDTLGEADLPGESFGSQATRLRDRAILSTMDFFANQAENFRPDFIKERALNRADRVDAMMEKNNPGLKDKVDSGKASAFEIMWYVHSGNELIKQSVNDYELVIKDRESKQKLQQERGKFGPDIAPADDPIEKMGDAVGGLVGFLGELALFKKFAPGPVAFEMIEMLEQGKFTGKGLAMGGALEAGGELSKRGFKTATAVMGAESAAFGGMEALAGGDSTDIAIAMMIPPILRANNKLLGFITKAERAFTKSYKKAKTVAEKETSLRKFRAEAKRINDLNDRMQFEKNNPAAPKIRKAGTATDLKKYFNARQQKKQAEIDKFNKDINDRIGQRDAAVPETELKLTPQQQRNKKASDAAKKRFDDRTDRMEDLKQDIVESGKEQPTFTELTQQQTIKTTSFEEAFNKTTSQTEADLAEAKATLAELKQQPPAPQPSEQTQQVIKADAAGVGDLVPTAKEGDKIFFRGESGPKRTTGLINLTENKDAAAAFIRGGTFASEEEAMDAFESGQVEEELSQVQVLKADAKNTLSITDNKALGVLSKLSSEGDPEASKIINDAMFRQVKNQSTLGWWVNTKPHTQEAWDKVLIPQLKELGYDSLSYQDDVMLGKTTAVFDINQLTPVREFTTKPTKTAPKVTQSDLKRPEVADPVTTTPDKKPTQSAIQATTKPVVDQKSPEVSQKTDKIEAFRKGETIKVVDGIEFKIFKGHKGPSIRTFDIDSGETITVKSFPTKAAARKAFNEAVKSARNIAKPVPAKKSSYTFIEKKWVALPKLVDTGTNLLMPKGTADRTKIGMRGRQELDRLPTRLPAVIKALKVKTDEVWEITNTKGENYWLAPKKAIAEVRAELGEDAFVRNPAPERSKKQKINDHLLNLKAQQRKNPLMQDHHIGQVLNNIIEGEPDLNMSDAGPGAMKFIQEYRDEQGTTGLGEGDAETVAQPLSVEEEILRADSGEIVDDIFGGLEEAQTGEVDLDLFDQSLAKEGATGEQKEFLDIEDFKTDKTKDEVNEAGDIEGQSKLFESGVTKKKPAPIKKKAPESKPDEGDLFTPDPTTEEDIDGPGGFAALPGKGRPKGKKQVPRLTMDKIKSPDAEIEGLFEETNIAPNDMRNKASEIVFKIKGGIRERFVNTPHIIRTPANALARDIIRTLPEIQRAAKEQAIRDIIDFLNGDGSVQALDKAGLELLRRKVFAQDQLYEANLERSVARGITVEQWEAENKRLDGEIALTPSVKKAFEARQKLWDDVGKDLLDRGVLDQEGYDNKTYIRHFVLDYMDSIKIFKGGRKSLKEPYRVYKTGRIENIKDISTNYLSVEVQALSDIYADNAIEDAQIEIAEYHDKTAEFKQAAKDKNFEILVGGKDMVKRIRELEGKVAESLEGGNAQKSDERAMRKEWIGELNELDPTRPFRQRIAIHMSKFAKLKDIDNKDITMAELAAEAKLQTEAALSARGVFKAISDRKKFINEQLGKHFRTTADMARLKGYAEWWTKRPNLVYHAKTVDEAVINSIVEANGGEMGDTLEIPRSAIRDALVMGKRSGIFIPADIAAQLDDLPVNHVSNMMVESFTKPAVLAIKRWYLRINPLRYNSRNQLGDLERFNASGHMRAALLVPKAIEHLMKKDSPEFKGAVKYGTIGTSLWHEMGDVSKIKEFERFKNITTPKGFKDATKFVMTAPFKAASFVGTLEQNLTQFREDVLRMALYLETLENIKAGNKLRHWAGDEADINAIAEVNPERAAAKLSRETMVDYGDFTPWENNVLRNGAIPFYSWMKKNATFWPRVLINATKEGTAEGKKAGKKVAVVAGLNMAKWAVRVLAGYAAAHWWNNRDEEARNKEESLAFWKRGTPHINIGNKTLWGQTALSDFAEWFDAPELAALQWRRDAGFIPQGEFAMEAAKIIAKAPVNKVIQSLNPFLKAPGTAIFGMTAFPDALEAKHVAKAGSIKALKRAILDILGADAKKFIEAGQGKRTIEDALYAYFAGWWIKPTDPQTLIDQIKRTKAYSTLKNDSQTTGRKAGGAKSGKERSFQEGKIRARAVNKL